METACRKILNSLIFNYEQHSQSIKNDIDEKGRKMLFEESGVILNPGEHVVMKGAFSGKVPTGLSMQGSRNLTRWEEKAVWKNLAGELVLTNQRGFVLSKQGAIRKRIEMQELKIIGAALKQEGSGKAKLGLLLDVGESQAKGTEFDVESATEWRDKIMNTISGGLEWLESGVVLNPGEHVVMKGGFSGKVPTGLSMQGSRNLTRWTEKAVWKDLTGELVLTNQRGFALSNQGTIEIHELRIRGAGVKKSLLGKAKLELLLDVGESQAKGTEFDVESATEWRDKIINMIYKSRNQA
jgi:uncharacterized protein with beta-barrel porin domain